MNNEKANVLLQETNLNICLDFLAKMIEKYVDEMEKEKYVFFSEEIEQNIEDVEVEKVI